MPNDNEQAKLASLHKQRGLLKRKITDFLKYITDLKTIKESSQLQSLTRSQLIELQTRIDGFIPVLDRIDPIQTEICCLSISNEDEEQNWVSDFEASYFSVLSEAKILLEESSFREESNSQANSVHSPSNSVVSNQQGTNTGFQHLKLPTISLPKFDGKYTGWLEFHDIFNSLIHDNDQLTGVQKFHYLKASLEGDAADIIKSLSVSTTNYDIAWSLLCDRFTNKKLLVQNHLRALFHLKEVTKESAGHLRELLDTTTKHLRSLSALGQPVEHWDPFIIYLIVSKFDKVTAREWETYKIQGELPTLNELKTFLGEKADMLDNLTLCHSEHKPNIKVEHKSIVKAQGKLQKSYVSSNLSCYYCRGSHAIYNCAEFLKLSVQDRIENVKRLKLCSNCLRNSHSLENCGSKSKGCRKCQHSHNTLLHLEQSNPEPAIQSREEKTRTSHAFSSRVSCMSGCVLLATAVVLVKDNLGKVHECKLLLDSASQSNFISRELVSRLGLKQYKVNVSIQGINQVVSPIKTQCSVTIQSRVTSFSVKVNCLVLDKISDDLHSSHVSADFLEIPDNLELADPCYSKSGRIDMLIGAQFFWTLLSQGQIKLGANLPTLQNSKLGWILSGPLGVPIAKQSHSFLVKSLDIQEQLQRFWELEECPKASAWSEEQQLAENHFCETFYQDTSGRCVVSVPFKDSLTQLGESYTTAMKRFLALEKRLHSNPILQQAYISFMDEYEQLGHMRKVDHPSSNLPHYYLPHHGVVNESSATTKLRVVFDGSCPTSTGVSLNDVQVVGPTVQDQLFNILARFRQHPVAFSADVQKMYRQVRITDNDSKCHRILWRRDNTLPVQTYELQTVTYGTASAPFLATRCLLQIANKNSGAFPEACKIIRSDFYVDDVLSGANTVREAKILCKQIVDILHSIKFPLHKWISNDPGVVSGLMTGPSTMNETRIGSAEMTKTLGLFWSHTNDCLSYKITGSSAKVITKRVILSETSQVFDPLGLLSACTIIAKTLLQRLWQSGVDWDDEVPESINNKWNTFRTDLLNLNSKHIPRHALCIDPVRIELHCFSDASEIAYAACIFIKSVNAEGNASVKLLCAKARVAPLKQLTIPRLELCAAQLSAKLMTIVKEALRLKIDQIYMWSDSTIVLGWLKSPPNTLKVFVSHRVSDIQSRCKDTTWRHVPTKDNPADLASRGILPSVLANSQLWWHGPTWLLMDKSHWPSIPPHTPLDTLPELKRVDIVLSVTVHQSPIIFSRFSNWNRLLRTTAYCFRFMFTLLKRIDKRSSLTLTIEELRQAETYLIKTIQYDTWSTDISCLKATKPLPRTSCLVKLLPFLDDQGLLRVGGRLQSSSLDFQQKHPILLPKHYLTKLLFINEHNRLAHAGPQQVLYSLRERYWPLNGRNYARSTVHNCIRCFKCRPKNITPLMGNLPSPRVQPALPFQVVGVDFAGPFLLKDRQGRGFRVNKCYVALYVCFAIKAVHIELVSSLSTEAFLASLRRFISRRGKPTQIFSDNGSNFVGAHNELSQFINLLKSDEKEIAESLSGDHISWSFIPPLSPNFGGLWEAGVKSLKFHLKRIVGNALLTFEQFSTLLCQVECILNSRPLSPMSSQPNDLEPLTPSHFLIGRCLTALPEPSLLQLPTNRLSEFQRVQQLVQHLWKRWKSEYLHNLQQRNKWYRQPSNIRPGTMVLLQDDTTPPFSWPLGRIKEVFPGKDNHVRVVSVQTSRGVYKRPTTKVFPLPISLATGDENMDTPLQPE